MIKKLMLTDDMMGRDRVTLDRAAYSRIRYYEGDVLLETHYFQLIEETDEKVAHWRRVPSRQGRVIHRLRLLYATLDANGTFAGSNSIIRPPASPQACLPV